MMIETDYTKIMEVATLLFHESDGWINLGMSDFRHTEGTPVALVAATVKDDNTDLLEGELEKAGIKDCCAVIQNIRSNSVTLGCCARINGFIPEGIRLRRSITKDNSLPFGEHKVSFFLFKKEKTE